MAGFLKDILGGLIDPVTDLIGEVVVDKDKKREIELKLQEIVDRADARYHEELMGQIQTNQIEASHASVFVAGWRPFIGWTGGVGLAYSFVLAPFIEFVARANGYVQEMPTPDATQLMTLIMAMLGVGAMRSYDKVHGTAPLPKNAGGGK
jgi:Holin of 3TMs, for gene-transfer release